MIQLIILIFASIVIAYSTKTYLYKLFPIVMMTSVIITYSFALFLDLNTSVYITCTLAIITAAAFIAGQKMIAGRKSLSAVFTPHIVIAFAVCIITFLSYSGHRVIHWDDLNVWAIYPKTLFYINRLPLGVENCSVTYKDYQPIQQIMQYFFIYGMKSFSEERLFQINACFMYILCMPILSQLDKEKKLSLKNAAIIILYVIFPHTFTTQFYSKLGVDYLISILFGLGVYYIYCIYHEYQVNTDEALEQNKPVNTDETLPQNKPVNTDETLPQNKPVNTDKALPQNKPVNTEESLPQHKPVLLYLSLITVMTYLALIKSSGIILVLFLFVLMLVMLYKKGESCLKYIITAAIPIIYYLSWKIFAKATGNTGYMSEKIDSNFKDLVRSIINNIPSYTGEVLLNYIKSVFTLVLTREKFGVTAIVIIAVIAVIFYFCKDKLPKKAIYAVTIGFVFFCIGHVYMYLFVFDEWEAHGLMEFDRYICQYMAGVLLFCIILLLESNVKDYITYAILIIFIVTLPYSAAKQYLIPSNFNVLYEREYKELKETGTKELKDSGLMELNIPNDGENNIVLVANAWDDAIIFFTYEAVPKVIEGYANVPAIEEGSLYSTLRWRIDLGNAKYAYVCNNAKDSFGGDFDAESAQITDDGKPLVPGFYEIIGDGQFHRMDVK